MTTTDFTTTILVDNSAKEAFDAILDTPAWWQGQIEGSTNKQGDEFIYRMPGHHYSKQQILELIPNEKIVWLVSDSELKFDNKSEWTGTKIVFEISPAGNKTQVRFTHIGLIPAFECYSDCSWGWEKLVQESLFSLITTGKGTNVFG
ncbi:MAG: hypothetical protein BGO69_02670 [Bacteroidetes bacterium 46-16]|nr:MAG: hypothetical protein BGO69_02670 [Bacteroidetes bacterium 46-16]